MVDHADGPVAPFPEKRLVADDGVKQQELVVCSRLVHHILPAPGPGWRHLHLFHWRIPFGPGNHTSSMTAEANQNNPVVVVPLADQLTDVHHPSLGHVGVASITDVPVVLPDDPPRLWSVMLEQAFERLSGPG
jgi:hypothetical protein